ncbi:MAG: hypothetical protein FJ388_23655 [Verrucomicrobia bacterium]|nr:hypothetical protein [Verrucomicrobiota bacterium]
MKSDRLELARMAYATLAPRERREFQTMIGGPAAPAPAPVQDRLLRRGEVAQLLARSPRAVDRLAADGVLPRVTLPGRQRGAGFRLSAVQSLIAGAC